MIFPRASLLLYLFCLFTFCEGLLTNGRNVRCYTRMETYMTTESYKSGWSRRYRIVSRSRIGNVYVCHSGWATRDGLHCDIGICFRQLAGTCYNGGTCVRPDICICRPGYKAPRCTDINECATGNGGCGQVCTNLNGSFRCSCKSGFGLLYDQKTCKPICFGMAPGTCPNGGICVSPNVCQCKPGFSQTKCSDPVVAFSAQVKQHVTDLKTQQKIPFENVITNLGDAYDSSGSVFRCPVRGVYEFVVTILSKPDDRIETELVAANVPRMRVYSGAHKYHGSGTNSVTLELEKGDTVYVRLLLSEGSYVHHLWSTFNGYLVQMM